MKAAILKKYGNRQLDLVGDFPKPAPGPGDLLVRVRAASVNPIDWKIMEGRTRALFSSPLPFVLGNDGSGVVESVGPGVTAFVSGDEVYFRPDKNRIGTFAEYCLVRESDAARKPRSLSFVEAASLPLVALTSWQAFFEKAQLRSGHNVLVHAGSGGVGVAAIQIAKHFGASVATTCGPTGVELVRRLGADRVIDYWQEDFSTGGPQFDIILDTLGGEGLKKSFRVLKPGGTVVSVSASVPTPDVAKRFGKGILLQSVFSLANLSLNRAAARAGGSYRYLFMESNGEQLAEISKLVESGQLSPVIDEVFPFQDTNAAVAKQRSGRSKGKIVIEIT